MENNNTGKYVFDKKTGKVVKISDEVPSLSKKEHSCGPCCGCRHNYD
ncbi:MAG: hypothetical protein ACI352_06775 [Elusimicrobiaceae bacterium]|nr:hypothetical protein [Elusimicrobiota bacterium]